MTINIRRNALRLLRPTCSVFVTLTGLSGCMGAPQNTLLPIDMNSKHILKEGTPSKNYRLFTTIKHLETIDSDRMIALEHLAEQETKKYGYCPHGFELMKRSLIYGEGSDAIAIIVLCK